MSASPGIDEDAYFAWQSNIGEFGGWANQSKFTPYIRPEDTVVDVGCGGGYLLKELTCQEKRGVEPNPAAAETARAFGLSICATAEELPDAYADVMISNHALEHMRHPLQELRTLYNKLKPEGTIVLVVPCESIGVHYRADDINHHLYSWSPMSLGNLLTEAGYELVESKPYLHKWPPGYRLIAKLGHPLFDLSCRIYARLARRTFQVRAVARKRSASSETYAQ